MTTPTTNFAWSKPVNAGDSGAWGTELNAALDAIDATVFGIQSTADAALPEVGGTMTGQINVLTSAAVLQALGAISGAQTFNIALGQYFTFSPSAALTITLSNVPAVASTASGLIFRITNGGAFAITWPTSFIWPSNTAPALTTSGVDVIGLITDNGGTTFRAVLIAKAFTA